MDSLNIFVERYSSLIVRILVPCILSLWLGLNLYKNRKEVITGKLRSYTAFSMLCFFYGIFNIFADGFRRLSVSNTTINLLNASELIEHFVHREADNLTIFTVGVALFMAIDAVFVTREDIEKSEYRIKKNMLDSLPKTILQRSLWRCLLRRGATIRMDVNVNHDGERRD